MWRDGLLQRMCENILGVAARARGEWSPLVEAFGTVLRGITCAGGRQGVDRETLHQAMQVCPDSVMPLYAIPTPHA